MWTVTYVVDVAHEALVVPVGRTAAARFVAGELCSASFTCDALPVTHLTPRRGQRRVENTLFLALRRAVHTWQSAEQRRPAPPGADGRQWDGALCRVPPLSSGAQRSCTQCVTASDDSLFCDKQAAASGGGYTRRFVAPALPT